MKKILFLTFILLISKTSLSQQTVNYYFRDYLYGNEIKGRIANKSNFESYRIITPGYFDMNNDNKIEFRLLERTLSKWFPSENSYGYLVIDWEKRYFKDLRKYPKGSRSFMNAQNGFINLIRTIRSIRPNLKIGIYGIPYRFNYDFQRVDNSKFKTLINETDFIAPSLYIPFLDEKSPAANSAFLKNNLTDALQLAMETNKPVIPFIWYMYSGAFKGTKGKLMKKPIFDRFLNYIIGFTYKDNRINGLFWWEPSNSAFNSLLKNRNNSNMKSAIKTRDDIFKYYDPEN